MGVSSAMYAAITGLQTMGAAMSVISNNIANVNTVGFKAARAEFVDLLSQNYITASGSSQIGRGVRMGAINQVFTQGGFKTTNQDTDLALTGEGFFKVRDLTDNGSYYTRAGNFIFDNQGRMSLPTGQVLQGWALDATGAVVGSPVDIILPDTTAAAEETTRATYIVNLDEEASSRTNNARLSTRWNGADVEAPIDGASYVYQSSLRIYDELGGSHDLTIYFDPSDTVDNMWEYVVTCDPSEDMRTNNGNSTTAPAGTPPAITNPPGLPTGPGVPLAGTEWAGILQRGTITFEPNDTLSVNGGQIRDITAQNLNPNATSDNGTITAGPAGDITLDMTVTNPLGTYAGNDTPADYEVEFINNGAVGETIPSANIEYRYRYNGGAWSAYTPMVAGNLGPYQLEDGATFTLNAGLTATAGGGATIGTYSATYTTNWLPQTTTVDNGYFQLDAYFLRDPGPDPSSSPLVGTPILQQVEIDFGANNLNYNPITHDSPWTIEEQSSTQYAAASSTLFQTQDGLPSGSLQRVTFDTDGTMTAVYNNGRNDNPYRVAVTIFPNQWGLDKIGSNLYQETQRSGQGIDREPGTNGAGEIAPNSLEQSNVDLADEFVDMILQQRGFQANSKVITTTDTMLAELINLKR